MSFKATQVYVVMRTDDVAGFGVPVAVFDDLETAEGNAEAYNLDMQEREIKGITFSVAVTMHYV